MRHDEFISPTCPCISIMRCCFSPRWCLPSPPFVVGLSPRSPLSDAWMSPCPYCAHPSVCSGAPVPQKLPRLLPLTRLLPQGIQEDPRHQGGGTSHHHLPAREFFLCGHGASFQGPPLRVQGAAQGTVLSFWFNLSCQGWGPLVSH